MACEPSRDQLVANINTVDRHSSHQSAASLDISRVKEDLLVECQHASCGLRAGMEALVLLWRIDA